MWEKGTWCHKENAIRWFPSAVERDTDRWECERVLLKPDFGAADLILQWL